MGLFNSNHKKNEEREPLSGGGIVADYDCALKYAARQLDKYAREVFEDIDHPVEVLLNHRMCAARSAALLDTLVFVYGKTPKQVDADMMEYLKAKRGG